MFETDELPVFVPIRRQYFGGVRRQSGRGFFGTVGNLLSRLLPFAKIYILPSAAGALQDIVSDLNTEEMPLKESVKKRSVSALKNMARSYLSQTGSGRKGKRRSNKNSSSSSSGRKRNKPRKTKPKKPAKGKRSGRRKQKKNSRNIWQPNIIGRNHVSTT